jgi:2,5-diketo-D-gluconate reductase A
LKQLFNFDLRSLNASHKINVDAFQPNNLFNNELLKVLSSKYNKSIAQVVLRWLIQREVVAIPKSVDVKRMNENFNVFDFELSADDMKNIKSLDQGGGLIYSV